jgi:hypothetical protein
MNTLRNQENNPIHNNLKITKYRRNKFNKVKDLHNENDKSLNKENEEDIRKDLHAHESAESIL